MKKSTQFILISGLFALLVIGIVSAYTFTVGTQVLLEGTVFTIDGIQFAQSGADISVKLNNTWYDLESDTYTRTNHTAITMLTNVVCGPCGAELICSSEGGSGCGS